MMIIKLLLEAISNIDQYTHRDPRTSILPLLGSPLPMFSIIALYLVLVKRVGPRWMEGRPAYKLKSIMQLYNLMQVLINLYVFYGSLRYSYMQSHFKLSCQAHYPKQSHPTDMLLLRAAYVYYISKYLDLFDTIFFVLRKKYNQISFLHVYHHSIMIFAVWVYVTLLFASHYTVIGVVNSFIHVCMYSYYFVAATQLSIDLSWVKRFMTKMQIAQFCFFTVHIFRALVNNWCGLEYGWLLLVFLQNFFMLVLFCDFYYRAYINKSRRALRASEQDSRQAIKRD